MFIDKKLYYEIEEFKNMGLTAMYSTAEAGSPAPYNNPKGLEELKDFVSKIGKNDKKLVYARQTHSDNIVILEDEIQDSYEEIDGFITKRKDVLLVTFYADCLPIYFYDKKQEIIGICHSGWLGTHKGIGPKMLDIFIDEFKSKKEDLVIGLGIGVGHCCYEVSEDFYEKFKSISTEELLNKTFYRKDSKLYFNNEDYNYYRFKNLGIENIIKSDICTYCQGNFHSYRRDGQNSGRNIAILGF